ncbi:MAG: bile acid:sodium symporter family protein [Cyclobacteriaceae bacterium]|nr:bile acid:sodium symporter family protein [Cyclobacteriaceae bacterium]
MQQSVLVSVFLPVALGIIMLGLGLSLVLDDFKRIVKYPKAVGIALICQMILLPIICFFIAQGFGLQPALAVGLMLLAASPGGATANLYSHLSNGDVALNITLTAVNSILALFTLPIVINLSLAYFMESDQYIPMQFAKVAEVFVVVLTPVAIGMIIRHKAPSFADKMNKPVKILSALFLILIIAAVTIKEKQLIIDYAGSIGLPILAFNILSMAIGYFVPLLFSLKKKQAIAMGMEIGIHNGTLGIYIALSVLGSSQMSIPSALYGLLMFFTAAAFGFLVNIGKKPKDVEEATV